MRVNAADKPVILSSISYALGSPKPIEALPELSDEPSLLTALRQGGLRNYLEYDGGPLTLARESVQQTLAQDTFSADEIDCVLFATDSLTTVGGQDALVTFLDELGLENAYPVGVRLSECANFHVGVAVAKSLIKAAQYRNVLLVSVDLARLASPASRIVSGGISVMSDAAASCVISERPVEGFIINGSHNHAERSLQRGGLAANEELKLRITSHRVLFERLLREAGWRAAQVSRVFPSNFIPAVARMFHMDSGFTAEQIVLENLPRIGHCLGSDGLIGLLDSIARAPIDEGERLVLSGAGPTQLGATLLTANATLSIY
ncbi:hypothetical protein [Halothiobacillus sp.]|uniref:hypothetical protein n=1 Tax=Halothiobacillus sp. TaxID=1891311 RepID=UPI0026139E61|nr:hypothetical protein [Halothiobacillus sp.]MDD4965745.1 hypothetical protein [Halothiobacillus sp.]